MTWLFGLIFDQIGLFLCRTFLYFIKGKKNTIWFVYIVKFFRLFLFSMLIFKIYLLCVSCCVGCVCTSYTHLYVVWTVNKSIGIDRIFEWLNRLKIFQWINESRIAQCKNIKAIITPRCVCWNEISVCVSLHTAISMHFCSIYDTVLFFNSDMKDKNFIVTSLNPAKKLIYNNVKYNYNFRFWSLAWMK